MFFHDTASAEAGTLPTTTQSARVVTIDVQSEANNQTMDTSIGVLQTSLAFTNTTQDRNNRNVYFARFISPELNQTSVAANTWRLNFAVKMSVSSTTGIDDYPTTDGVIALPITVYVWRPSTGVKVGNIFDANQAGYFDVGHNNSNVTAETSEDGTFSGSLVNCAVGDVIVCEAFASVYRQGATSTVLSFFYDGTAVTLTNGTTVSDHASFLETPENLSFVTAAATTGRLYRSFSNTGFIPAIASVTF